MLSASIFLGCLVEALYDLYDNIVIMCQHGRSPYWLHSSDVVEKLLLIIIIIISTFIIERNGIRDQRSDLQKDLMNLFTLRVGSPGLRRAPSNSCIRRNVRRT